MLAICAASHSGRRLNGFDSYLVLAITSRLCICIRVAVQRRTVAAVVSLRVVARCGSNALPCYGDNALSAAEKGRLSTQQRYVNRLIRLKFSTVHVMAS